jgi:hypothetical protein
MGYIGLYILVDKESETAKVYADTAKSYDLQYRETVSLTQITIKELAKKLEEQYMTDAIFVFVHKYV